MPTLILWLLLVSWLLSGVLGAVVLRLSNHFQWVDRAGEQRHKQRTRTVPNTGGIAIFLAIALPMTVVLAAVWAMPGEWWIAASGYLPAGRVLLQHLAGLRRTTAIGGGVLTALALLHLMGLIDDRRPLGPWVKLTYQAVIALGLVLLCDIRVLHFLDKMGGGWAGWEVWGATASTIISLAWVLTIINAMNFLDNMDGLAAGVGATIATVYLGATLIGGQWFVAGMAALLLGALLGFLLFNFPPARMYMGDAGSLVVGLMLAVISVRTTYFDATPLTGVAAVSPGLPTGPTAPGRWYGVLMPLMVMAIPLYDLVSVTMIRLREGRSPLRGDEQHFSHRLVRLGLSRRRAVVLIWMCTLATGLGGVMLGSLDRWQALLAAGQTLTILAVLAVIERSGRRS